MVLRRKRWSADRAHALHVADLRNNLTATDDAVQVRPPLWRQASLLRTQLKTDLEVYYGQHVSGEPSHSDDERTFLDNSVLKPYSCVSGPRRLWMWMWMWFRFTVLRADDPIIRARRLWQRVKRMEYKSRRPDTLQTNEQTAVETE
jgi:hypothetical protein